MNFDVVENEEADDVDTGELGTDAEWDDRKGLETERVAGGGLRVEEDERLHAPKPREPNPEGGGGGFLAVGNRLDDYEERSVHVWRCYPVETAAHRLVCFRLRLPSTRFSWSRTDQLRLFLPLLNPGLPRPQAEREPNESNSKVWIPSRGTGFVLC